MRAKINVVFFRRIGAILIILFLSALIEGGYNYHALLEGYEPIDLTEFVETDGEEGDETYVISYESEEGIYIQQLKLTGEFPFQYSYSIVLTGYNSFGLEEEKYLSDTVNSWFSEFYTRIGGKVHSIKITLKKEKEGGLSSIFLLNEPELNKYRFLFWIIVLTLAYFVFFEKSFSRNLERFFLLYAIPFGLLTIASAQPGRVSWDEQIHFRNAYKVAYGQDILWTEAALNVKNANIVSCNTKAEYAQLRKYMNEAGEELLYTEKLESPVVSYAHLAYIPQAFFFRLGIWLKLPFSAAFALGKFGNLLVYLICMFFAIRAARELKLLVAFFAMMPTVLFQATSYTYDNIVTCFLTLGCVLWVNEMIYTERKKSSMNLILILLLFVIGSLSKAVYIPIVLLMLLLPWFRTNSRKKNFFLWAGLVTVFLLIMATFVLPAITNTVAGNLDFGGDSRGGDTSTVRQMLSMIQHPVSSIKLLITNIFSFDNFRNLGNAAADNYFFGNLMFLNFASMGILKDKWSALLIPVFLMLIFKEEKNELRKKRIEGWDRGLTVIILLMIVGLIWLALYLSFTPVGAESIAGVQARYYLPLIYITAIILRTDKLSVRISDTAAIIILQSTVVLLEAVLFYHSMLSGRFF